MTDLALRPYQQAVLDKLRALPKWAVYDMVGAELLSRPPRSGKTVVAESVLTAMQLSPSRKLIPNWASKRGPQAPQLNNLPPLPYVRRAVQAALENWSSK